VIALALALVARTPARLVILTYHDIIERRDAKALWFDCTRQELAGQLDWMRVHGAHFVTLDQVYRFLTGKGALPRKAVAITFADNYQGFWDRGYPELKKRHIPAAMFVHTGYVGDRAHGRPKMTWGELRTLDREALVMIESQTVSHVADLGLLSPEAQFEEFLQSKESLERHLGHPIHYLAYPNGKFDDRSEVQAKRAGYWLAFSEITEPADQSPSLFAVHRYVHTQYRKAFGRF
jgi:peptidoglycan/xylan/chitin deacetylase (PgdA/CDA1 family)